VDDRPISSELSAAEVAGLITGTAGTFASVTLSRLGFEYELRLSRTRATRTTLKVSLQIVHNLNETQSQVVEPWIDLPPEGVSASSLGPSGRTEE
jgi:hypothetical protein